MEYNIKTSRGPVRFHSVGEPVVGIPADTGNLISAAPELLSAAIAALTIVLRENADGSIARDLIKAIAKARGTREYN